MIQPIITLLTLANSGEYPGKRDYFYPVKDLILRRYGRQDGHDKQVLIKQCWHCIVTRSDTCLKCNGTGIYRTDVHWLERWVLGKELFHIPVPTHLLPTLIHPPVSIYSELVKHRQVDGLWAWRAALVLIVLFMPRTAIRLAGLKLRRAAYRKVGLPCKRLWDRWKIRKMEIPF